MHSGQQNSAEKICLYDADILAKFNLNLAILQISIDLY